VKVPLDECVTRRLRPLQVGHDVYSVRFLGWKGTTNGHLIARAAGDDFAAIVTTDHGMTHQHNPATFPLAIVVVHAASNNIADVARLVPAILALLAGPLTPGFHDVR